MLVSSCRWFGWLWLVVWLDDYSSNVHLCSDSGIMFTVFPSVWMCACARISFSVGSLS